MKFDCTITLTGFDAAIQQAIQNAAATLRARAQEQFLTEGAAYGTPWLPRSPRRSQLPHRPLLFQTGRLFGSLVDADHPEHIEEITHDATGPALIFGSSVPYAAFHQRGTRFIPARPMLTAAMLGGKEVPTS